MDRLVKEPFLLPAPAMPGDKRIAEHETDFVEYEPFLSSQPLLNHENEEH